MQEIAQDRPRPCEPAIRALAASSGQRRTMAAAGSRASARGAIRARLATGRCGRGPHRGLCIGPRARGSSALGRPQRCWRAAPAPSLSHASAACLWGFLPRWEPPPEVTPPKGIAAPRHPHPSLPVVTGHATSPANAASPPPPAPGPSWISHPGSPRSTSPAWSTTAPREVPAPRGPQRHPGPQPLAPRHQAAQALRREPTANPTGSPFRGRIPGLRPGVRPADAADQHQRPRPRGRRLFYPDANLIVEAGRLGLPQRPPGV